jgi:hypothetical protein
MEEFMKESRQKKTKRKFEGNKTISVKKYKPSIEPVDSNTESDVDDEDETLCKRKSIKKSKPELKRKPFTAVQTNIFETREIKEKPILKESLQDLDFLYESYTWKKQDNMDFFSSPPLIWRGEEEEEEKIENNSSFVDETSSCSNLSPIYSKIEKLEHVSFDEYSVEEDFRELYQI